MLHRGHAFYYAFIIVFMSFARAGFVCFRKQTVNLHTQVRAREDTGSYAWNGSAAAPAATVAGPGGKVVGVDSRRSGRVENK